MKYTHSITNFKGLTKNEIRLYLKQSGHFNIRYSGKKREFYSETNLSEATTDEKSTNNTISNRRKR